ncbi:MAG TPA: prolyl oligopeptidase family serine peptidase, partial [Polyangiales bacterium]
TWVFHGALDAVVPAETSQRMVRALQAAQAPVKLTLYEDLAHACWERAYRTPELYDWLLAQRNGALRAQRQATR